MELTSDLPRKSSRTNTQAISVPVTAFATATAIETNRVNLSAATASRPEMAVQKPLNPLSVLLAISAASGSSTITLSQAIEMPSSGGRIPAPRCGTTTAALLSFGEPQRLLDLCGDAPFRVEEPVVYCAPTPQPFR